MTMETYLGIDVGSITTKLAVLGAAGGLVESLYLPTEGQPLRSLQRALRQIGEKLPEDIEVRGVAATGSARYLAGVVAGADTVKNEITCQAVASLHYIPEVKTIIEIGGQDSKIIIIRDGMVADFGMNTVCAAGTGSFLDHQAARLRMSIEEFSRRAVAGSRNVRISGRCTVFAESDMVHQQQMGHDVDDIIYGLCRRLVENYLGDVAAGKEILSPVLFQGGVAFNGGIVRALREELGQEITVLPRHEVMGAIGAALIARENASESRNDCLFRGFDIDEKDYRTSSVDCAACPAACEIVRVTEGERVLACWGGKCDKWEAAPSNRPLRQAQGERNPE